MEIANDLNAIWDIVKPSQNRKGPQKGPSIRLFK